ncbi:hypothetical protein RCL1_006789 [Eukaryota sp. TZLM3-RCL]
MQRRHPPSTVQRQQVCTICDLVKPRSQRWAFKLTPKCRHERFYCDNCVARYIETQTNLRNTSITCLDPGCNQLMTIGNIRHFATTRVFQQYDRLATEKLLCSESHSDFRYCAAPNCGFGACYPNGSLEPIIKCVKCGAKTCFVDRVLWHEGLTCSQYDLAITLGTAQYLRVNTKNCPGYHVTIEKNDGCDHMTCSQCGYEFCWRCMANYNGERGIWTVGNSAHHRTCTYFA